MGVTSRRSYFNLSLVFKLSIQSNGSHWSIFIYSLFFLLFLLEAIPCPSSSPADPLPPSENTTLLSRYVYYLTLLSAPKIYPSLFMVVLLF